MSRTQERVARVLPVSMIREMVFDLCELGEQAAIDEGNPYHLVRHDENGSEHYANYPGLIQDRYVRPLARRICEALEQPIIEKDDEHSILPLRDSLLYRREWRERIEPREPPRYVVSHTLAYLRGHADTFSVWHANGRSQGMNVDSSIWRLFGEGLASMLCTYLQDHIACKSIYFPRRLDALSGEPGPDVLIGSGHHITNAIAGWHEPSRTKAQKHRCRTLRRIPRLEPSLKMLTTQALESLVTKISREPGAFGAPSGYEYGESLDSLTKDITAAIFGTKFPSQGAFAGDAHVLILPPSRKEAPPDSVASVASAIVGTLSSLLDDATPYSGTYIAQGCTTRWLVSNSPLQAPRQAASIRSAMDWLEHSIDQALREKFCGEQGRHRVKHRGYRSFVLR